MGLKLTEYGIESVSTELIENFNNHFDIEQKSMVLEAFREEGTIVLLSIDVSDLSKAIENNDFSDGMLHLIGKTDLANWNSIQKLTNKNEVNKIRKDFKGVKPDYIVLLYCQGNYVHAFSSD